jgi:hypothetical protein
MVPYVPDSAGISAWHSIRTTSAQDWAPVLTGKASQAQLSSSRILRAPLVS